MVKEQCCSCYKGDEVGNDWISVTSVTGAIMKTAQGDRKLSSVNYHKLSICCSDVLIVWITKQLRKQLENL